MELERGAKGCIFKVPTILLFDVEEYGMILLLRKMRPRPRARISTHSFITRCGFQIHFQPVCETEEPGLQKCVHTRNSLGKSGREDCCSFVSPNSPIKGPHLIGLKEQSTLLNLLLLLIQIFAGFTGIRRKHDSARSDQKIM